MALVQHMEEVYLGSTKNLRERQREIETEKLQLWNQEEIVSWKPGEEKRKCDRQCHAAEGPGMKAEMNPLSCYGAAAGDPCILLAKGMQSYVLGCEVIARMSVNTLLMSLFKSLIGKTSRVGEILDQEELDMLVRKKESSYRWRAGWSKRKGIIDCLKVAECRYRAVGLGGQEKPLLNVEGRCA